MIEILVMEVRGIFEYIKDLLGGKFPLSLLILIPASNASSTVQQLNQATVKLSGTVLSLATRTKAAMQYQSKFTIAEIRYLSLFGSFFNFFTILSHSLKLSS